MNEYNPLTPQDRADMLQGRHDGANGYDARQENHNVAYWVGYREGLITRQNRKLPVTD
jgi:hypothetical protein